MVKIDSLTSGFWIFLYSLDKIYGWMVDILECHLVWAGECTFLNLQYNLNDVISNIQNP